MKKYKNKNSGFTMVETLSVVAIMIILLAFGIVGVTRYRDYLKITELDNMAREIYMAAQNRAVLLQNSGRLQEELNATGTVIADPTALPSGITEGTFYITWPGTASDEWDELLPVGTIDSTLRDGKFYIVYEPISGSVTDVFFVEKGDLPTIEDSFVLADSGRDARMKNKPMLGWHHGDPADVFNTPLATPYVEVLIENGEELTLTVKYTLPSDLPVGVTCVVDPKVVLTYGSQNVELLKTDTATNLLSYPIGAGRLKTSLATFPTTAGSTVEFTWVLDSLEKDISGNFIKQFKELKSEFGSSIALGDDFTVTADLALTADGYIGSVYHAEATDNSLFANESTYTADGTGTARIATLRHLQNLHPDSGVGEGIRNAEQIANIDCAESRNNDGDALDSNYKFIPIVNNNLKSYDGEKNSINNLYVDYTGNAGLFGSIKGTAGDHAVVQNVRLIDAAVASSGTNKNIGALTGEADNCDFNDCWVYWSESDKLVDTTLKKVNYKVSGTIAGGLVGSASGTVKIQNSFAATTVTGTTIGGLIGSATGNVTIENSYADCYLLSSASPGRVGGLIGMLGNEKTAKLTNCYAAGFIMTPKASDSTAGLVENTVSNSKVAVVTSVDVYSVVRIIKNDGTMERPEYPLYAIEENSSLKPVEDDFSSAKRRYLYTVEHVAEGAFGGEFVYKDANKTQDQSHIYNLRYTLRNEEPFKPGRLGDTIEELKSPYSYPELTYKGESVALPHYGDWADLNTPAGLAYYEHYTEAYNGSKYGAMGYYENTEINTGLPGDQEINLYTSRSIDRDGYALVFEQNKEPVYLDKYRVEYGDSQTWVLEKMSESADDHNWKWTKYTKNGNAWEENANPETNIESFTITRTTGAVTKTYVLIPLPVEVVTGAVSEGDSKETKFYQKLTVYENTYYFNPHFAKTVKQPVKNADGSVKAPDAPTNGAASDIKDNATVEREWEKNAISVRTPRHFYALSRFQNTYVVENSTSKRYYFKQELDLDYGTYKGYSGVFEPSEMTPYMQVPIGQGTTDDGFKGAYDGTGHTIRNVFYSTHIDGSQYNINEDSQYMGLFRYVEYLWNTIYEVPDDTVTDLGTVGKNNPGSPGVYPSANEIRVGMLAGGAFRALNCTVRMENLTITSAKNNTNIYVGGLLGYTNKTADCHADITGCLSVEGTGSAVNVYVGGMQGLLWYEAPNSTSKAASLSAAATGNCYAGGLVGRSTDNNGEWVWTPPYRKLSNCSAEIGTLTVTSKGSGKVYGGGLAGWCDEVENCSAVVTEGVTVEGSGDSVYGGGLVGGGTNIQRCFAIARSVKGIKYGQNTNTETYIGYIGGLVGEVRKMELSNTKDNINLTDLKMQDSYAAAAELQGNTRGAVFGKSDIDAFNCHYLDGGVDSWCFMDKNYSPIGTDDPANVNGQSYANLKNLAGTLGMGTASNNAYPFPVSTKKGGSWYYFGTDWPEELIGSQSEVPEMEGIGVELVHYDEIAPGEYTINFDEDGHEECEGESSGYALCFAKEDMDKWSSVRIKRDDSDEEICISNTQSPENAESGESAENAESLENTDRFTVQSDPEYTFIKIPAEAEFFEGDPKITIIIELRGAVDPDSEETWEQTLTRWINSTNHTISETEPELEVETVIEAEPETGSETEIEPEPETGSESESETGAEAEPEPETEPKPDSESEPEPETEPEMKPEPDESGEDAQSGKDEDEDEQSGEGEDEGEDDSEPSVESEEQ